MASEAQSGSSNARGWLGFFLVTLSLVVEGFDLQAANFAGPAIIDDFGISKAELGPLLSASLFGVLFGAIFLAPLGDRHGRRKIIIWCCAAYGLVSLVSAAATDLTQLIALRFLIGIGLGAVLPNALALAGEFAPEKLLAAAAGLVGIGITFGGTLAGATAAVLLKMGYGWQGIFLAAGILPLAISVLLWLALPESPAFLRGEVQARAKQQKGSVTILLTPAERAKTFAIWASFTLVLMVAYLMTGWIPLVIKEQGFSIEAATWLATISHGGGVLGGVVASFALARRQWPVVAVFAAMAALFMLLLALKSWDATMLTILLILQGFFTVGTQNALNGSTGASYPPATRTLGLGWALGLGRVGSIVGPLAGSGAVLLGVGAAHHFFYLPVLPLLIAACLAVYLSRKIRTQGE